MLPNFFVIGAPRCASTAVCRHLAQHPDVFMSDPKELHFFSLHRKYGSAEGWEWYESRFAGRENQTAVGEGSTTYSDPRRLGIVTRRLAKHTPDCRIIFLVRHPLHRIESEWKLSASTGSESVPLPFNASVRDRSVHIARSSYFKTLEGYREALPHVEPLVIFYEDFKDRPDVEVRRCFKYLQVDPNVVVSDSDQVVNPSSKISVVPSWWKTLRQGRISSLTRTLVPDFAKSAIRSMVAHTPDFDARWDPYVWEYVVKELRDGTERFLTELGKPVDFWNFSDVQLKEQLPPAEECNRSLSTSVP